MFFSNNIDTHHHNSFDYNGLQCMNGQWSMPHEICYVWSHRCGATFSYVGINKNRLMKIINGNKRQGLNLGFWNCRRGLITETKEASTKM